MLALGIESSCDETAAAVVENGAKVLSNVIASQHDIHARFGGVVPELASRRHVENMPVVVTEALERAGVTMGDIDLFAVTRGPGLVGALLVGLSFAKGAAWALKKPLVPVHHLHGHIVAAGFNHALRYPHLCLLVSGGHTSLFRVDSPVTFLELASTRDDAAGEAFDKVAKLLGLGFPGGPAVEKCAANGDARAVKFTMPKVKGSALDFSFSGLKTATRLALEKKPKAEDVAASFQKTVADILVQRTLFAAKEQKLDYIVMAGGVACNGHLRREMKRAGDVNGLTVVWPEPVYCTDNAAMIAAAGYFMYAAEPTSPRWMDYLSLDAVANLPLSLSS
ncbi:MAG: tRNA (adenosine(37)-N6)-threonylcarbamoyltransferase complex transferase subunit TsaD [Nitrospinae bacterium]|nr:tRNA (adenosine(37)-N6)-threonylcarbamoyltransferase complex transferase subunit TsaD [Nitrospinota bacterium]